MKAHKILFVVFLVFGLIGAIRTNDPVSAHDPFYIHVNVNNEGQEDLDDMKVKVYFYDLGIVLQSNPFDLDDGDSTGRFIFWDVPSYVKPGYYFARITASNDPMLY